MNSNLRRRVLVTATATVAAVGGALALAACSSLPKSTVEERLLALGKNRRIAERGLATADMRVALLGESEDATLTYLHVPAARPDAARRPIVLVHGTPASLFTWGDVIFDGDGYEGLAATHDVFAIEVVGHGVTRTEAPPYSFQKCADFVVGAIEALGVGPVHLVGNSYGGEFCWRAALDRPDLVSTLTIVDSSGYTRPDDGWLPEEVAMREMTLAPYGWLFNEPEKIRTALQPHFPYEVTADQVEEVFTICENADNWEAMVDLARDENGTRQDEIPRITVPTLVLWGADDAALPADRDGVRFARDIPGAELSLLRDCGHYPQETVPGEMVRVLLDFVRRRAP